jgi:hypothetical protein
MKNLALLALILVTAATLSAQRKDVTELHITRQPSPLVNIRLVHDKYTGLTGQEYSAIISNISNQKITVTGTLSAITVCGTHVNNNFDVTIKPGESKGGSAYMFDMDGLTGTVQKESCANPQVTADPDNPNLKRYNRIKTVTITNLIAKISQDDQPGPAQTTPTEPGNRNMTTSAIVQSVNRYPTTNSTSGNGSYHTSTVQPGNGYTATYNAAMARLNNQMQTSQAVYNAFTSSLQQLQQLHDEKVQREQAQQQAEEQAEEERRQRLQAQREQERREEADRRAAAQAAADAALNRQWTYDQQLLGKYMTTRSTSEIPANVKQVYYITYQRSYNTGAIQVRTYSVNQYKDGTWMFQNDLREKIKFTSYLNSTGVGRLLGFFLSKEEVRQLLTRIKERASNPHIDESYLALNGTTGSASGNDNFWNQ